MLRRRRIARVSGGCSALLGALGIARGLRSSQLRREPQPGPPARPVPAVRTWVLPRPEGRYRPIPRRNLFSPNRTEPAMVARVEIGGKPLVHGVVVDGPRRTYLEDSATGGMVGSAIGARLAGGRLQTGRSDRVLIARPSGVREVLLADPAPPRPASGGVPKAAGSRVSPAAAVFPPGGSMWLTQGQEGVTAPAMLTCPSLIQPSRSVPR